MIDFTWKVFSQTGNIETYLLMKELENSHKPKSESEDEKDIVELDSNF
ncbi:YqzL family protein [Salinibacillus xinjiangensis]|uniref:YqzL family protein n=1 Tax=Salinibacillus xinjiangensis TaxID=1229268 RepID=A0A6G1X6U1_9BACI|nr:YqzL family protein [Salinibacillus xinjiangensis]MRG86625.1 YqzL family protein [Salinibacillus xinjiangensis]